MTIRHLTIFIAVAFSLNASVKSCTSQSAADFCAQNLTLEL